MATTLEEEKRLFDEWQPPAEPVNPLRSLNSVPDKNFDGIVKEQIHRHQLMDHQQYGEMACAKCRLVRAIEAFYRCRFCGVWYCGTCADAHFLTSEGN